MNRDCPKDEVGSFGGGGKSAPAPARPSDLPVAPRGDGTPAKCRSCGAAIVFAGHPDSGKLAPFELDAGGDWTIANGAAARATAPSAQADMFAAPAPRYTSHFARCPQAKEWRKPR